MTDWEPSGKNAGEMAEDCLMSIPAGREEDMITLETLDNRFSICQIEDFARVDICRPFCFTAATDSERSLLCPEQYVPDNIIKWDDGWKGFRIIGQLDFSLIGILSRISGILADAQIGIFAVSTFDTDYVFTKEENFRNALKALEKAGYEIRRK